jgi:hypothetical protein
MVDEMQELADRDSWRLLNSTLNCGNDKRKEKKLLVWPNRCEHTPAHLWLG